MNNTSFQKKKSEQIRLPTLAKNIPALLQVLADDNLNYQQMADVIKQFPVITTRLIFLANSPWSAPVSPISSIEQACARLGKSIVKSISIALSLSSSFDTRKCPAFDTINFWTSAMLVSEGAGLMATHFPAKANDPEFVHIAQTAGVLHNLGLLWLADNLPAETSTALQSVATEAELDIKKALQHHTGTDYCEVGSWIGRQLNLPDTLIIAIEQHHNSQYLDTNWELALIIGTSANMVSALHEQKETFSMGDDDRLKSSGLTSTAQAYVYQQLSSHFIKTKELATTLF